MCQNLVDSKTLAWVLSKHAVDEILGLCREGRKKRILLQVELLIADSSGALFAVGFPKGKPGRKEGVQKGAEAVDVNLDTILFLLKDFWSKVSVSSNLKSSLVRGVGELVSTAEVAQLEDGCAGARAGDEDVFHLDVAVNDVSVVELF